MDLRLLSAERVYQIRYIAASRYSSFYFSANAVSRELVAAGMKHSSDFAEKMLLDLREIVHQIGLASFCLVLLETV